MSSFVTRPDIPVPFSFEMSMPCSFAILRTSGEERTRRRSSRVDGAAGVEDPEARAGVDGAEGTEATEGADVPAVVAGAVAAGAGVDAAFSPCAPISATTLLTGTVSPSLTLISRMTPAPGDGISASTLSVEISNSGSSLSMGSPTFLIQRTIVPSAIDSPICGITTSVAKNPSVKRREQMETTRTGVHGVLNHQITKSPNHK